MIEKRVPNQGLEGCCFIRKGGWKCGFRINTAENLKSVRIEQLLFMELDCKGNVKR